MQRLLAASIVDSGSLSPKTHLREARVNIPGTCVIVIDMQNFCCHPHGPVMSSLSKTELAYTNQALRRAVTNQKALIDSVKARGGEVIFTTIESLTKDGRDRSLDYKISGFNVPRGSWGGRVLSDLLQDDGPFRQGDDCLVMKKTSSSVFISTNIAFVLRNLGISQVVIVGGLTDQCVESAVRDACDEGFLVSLVDDATYTHSAERHERSLQALRGYCRIRSTAALLSELNESP